MPANERPPLAASSLGFLGLIPFIALAIFVFLAPEPMRASASYGLLAYGATILSFLGGIHWGLAIASSSLMPRLRALQLGLSVVPQLLGWAALLAPFPVGHALTAAALLAILGADFIAARFGLVPAWFTQLRWPLSCAAATALIVAALRS